MLNMKMGKHCSIQTCWIVLCLLSTLSTTFAHSEDIHDVSNNQERTHENSKQCPSSANKGYGEDVYEMLWQENLNLAEKTLKLPFLQHMQSGNLQADNYTTFMIQDIYYLAKVTDMLKEMSKKVQTPLDLKDFMQGTSKSYEIFKTEMLKTFNLKGVSEIKVVPAIEGYLKTYESVMAKDKPIMFAVSLLPCSRLWVCLAKKLNISPENAYWTWKKNNMDGQPEKDFKALLNKYLKTKDDIKRAKEIFKEQMWNEYNFFKESLQTEHHSCW
ncbi:aminopyrimidine aminohydrolase-like [Fundulus diaphanus]